ncbi:hypothetical protein [Burkholderia ubonensis]|uniref:hypothetical protein n=1 Tax=Burkholderia ubonensis TaxID=101571 RepID=UPI0015C7DC28|nr:hypothetical protein [Burkholderia ubonensis]
MTDLRRTPMVVNGKQIGENDFISKESRFKFTKSISPGLRRLIYLYKSRRLV